MLRMLGINLSMLPLSLPSFPFSKFPPATDVLFLGAGITQSILTTTLTHHSATRMFGPTIILVDKLARFLSSVRVTKSLGRGVALHWDEVVRGLLEEGISAMVSALGVWCFSLVALR
jgi:hypothetical protein